MKISQLLAMLQRVRKEIGDAEIAIVPGNGPGGYEEDIRISALPGKLQAFIMGASTQEKLKTLNPDDQIPAG